MPVPEIPLADLPILSSPKVSALTRTLASCSPTASSSSVKFPEPPSSPSRSPVKRAGPDFLVPFPVLKSPTKRSALQFPQTPSRRDRILAPTSDGAPPQTPSSVSSSPSKTDSVPSTPVHQKGDNSTVLQTPSTSRRQALYERVRQRSMSKSPTKSSHLGGDKSDKAMTPSMTRDQMLKLQQEELRRRCLLGRLAGVAESIWMSVFLCITFFRLP